MRRDDPDAVPLQDLAKVPWPASWSEDGIIELLEPLVNADRRSRIGQVLDSRLGSVTLLLDGPHDPHNVAAVMRSCDAFALQHLHIASDLPLLLSHKVAQGTERWVTVTQHSTPPSAVNTLRSQNFSLIAAHPQGRLLPEELAHLPHVAIVLGNEHRGIAHEVLAACDNTVRIPMRGFVESLNLSVSAALLLHAATRSRRGDLPTAERRSLYARGLWQSVIRARDIVAASHPR